MEFYNFSRLSIVVPAIVIASMSMTVKADALADE